MTNDAPPSSASEIAPTLIKVLDRLAAQTIDRDKGYAALNAILATDTIWEGSPPDHVTRLRES